MHEKMIKVLDSIMADGPAWRAAKDQKGHAAGFMVDARSSIGVERQAIYGTMAVQILVNGDFRT
jgi:hypothetical protein